MKKAILLFVLLSVFVEGIGQEQRHEYREKMSSVWASAFNVSPFIGPNDGYKFDYVYFRFFRLRSVYVNTGLSSWIGSDFTASGQNTGDFLRYLFPIGFYKALHVKRHYSFGLNTNLYLIPLRDQKEHRRPRFAELAFRFETHILSFSFGYRHQFGRWEIERYDSDILDYQITEWCRFDGTFLEASIGLSWVDNASKKWPNKSPNLTNLIIARKEIVEAYGGNGDQKIQPNETIKAKVTIQNTGKEIAKSVEASTLIDNRNTNFDDKNINVTDRNYFLGDINPGEFKSFEFSFNVVKLYSKEPDLSMVFGEESELPIYIDFKEKFEGRGEWVTVGALQSLGLRLGKEELTITDTRANDENSAQFVFEDEIPTWIQNAKELNINGEIVKVHSINAHSNHIKFLGDSTAILKKGLNWMSDLLNEGKKDFRKFKAWIEDGRIIHYNTPYQKSYAIIVAIDDYKRKKDSKKRGPTRFEELSFMISDAKRLEEVLKKVGFPKENIISLYDDKATSDAIEVTLKSFWQGGEHDEADRLFFYFGGHGDTTRVVISNPYLVTYDYDESKPTQTSFLMNDLIGRHAQNITAHHVMFALDACYTGLINLSTPSIDSKELQKVKLSIIKRDTENKARNILIAGTGNQRAFYDSGGLFTKTLINALNGNADLNKDGIISFFELGIYVRDEVTPTADSKGVSQDPKFYTLDRYGEGRIIFEYAN